MPAPGKQNQEAESRTTAVIGDLSGSRNLERSRRQEVQGCLTDLLEELNDDLQAALVSRFTVTLGDEFQGLLCRPAAITEVLWRLRRELPAVRLWMGVGHGGLDTPLRPRAIGMDGPAFHRAREGVERARKEAIHGGVFVGFGLDDTLLTGLARLLDHHRHSFTAAQIEAIDRVRDGRAQSEVAAELGVTQQAISKRLKAAAWDVYRMGEAALEDLLARYDTDEEWDR